MRKHIEKDSKGKLMKPFYTIQKRDSKQTIGLHKHYGNKMPKNEVLKMVVYGNFDILNKSIIKNSQLIDKEHSTDKGYFKKVYVLSKYGKQKLEKLKNNL